MASNLVPSVQRAWVVVKRGHPSKALALKEDYPVQKTLRKGDVLLKIQAAALNPVGYKVMKMAPNFIAKRPAIAEYDLAGVVVDANGTEFKEGDAVFGFISVAESLKTRQGSLAQYAAIPADHLVTRPENITPTEAAGITLAAQTAHEALFTHMKLEPGQTVFINGGSSAVGLFAIQIAKAKGLKVVATASGKNEELIRSMGVDEFIDYTKEPLHAHLIKNPPETKFHGILDAVGLVDPSLYTHSPAYLAPGCLFLSTGPLPRNWSASEISQLLRYMWMAQVWPSWLGGIKRPWKVFNMANHKETLEDLRSLVADGKLKGVGDSVHPFSDVLKAYERMMSGRATGKIVVTVEEPTT
ncbi:hypothetical protein HGRIS_013227 [Hohenbuehelia grisea]|uniref:Enoyl reductase (ER) domain-containing protein n=1 Tax=Hohenbuehelia grisea TaxID=104357 RepID=A0ABR3IUT1_9AGAR